MSRTHGLAATYRVGRCRCQPCREAHTAAARQEQGRRVEKLKANPEVVPHGRASTYRNWACRCRPCTAAYTACRAYQRRLAVKERGHGN